MRKLFILFNIMFSAVIINAQNIGIGTNSPNGSSILDITSTSKGLLIPRMTTALRTTIASPILGLLVFDTDTKTIWTHDGSAWKNLYTSGGLSLPFSQSVNTAIPAFQIANQSTGAAIEASSSNEYGVGLTAKNTGVYGWGLNAYSNRPGAKSINAFADSGTVFHGENNYPGNSNTLMSLINKGLGKTTIVQLANASNTSANMQIAGNNLGEQLKIYQTNAANSSAAISIENSGSGESVEAISTTGPGVVGTSATSYGIKGITSTTNSSLAAIYGLNSGTAGNGVMGVANFPTGYGVQGSSTTGTGVFGYSNDYTAISGSTINGTALYGNSNTGNALETNGKVKIAGGNTDPSAGAVLTSDASGNAVWKTNRLAFKAMSYNDNYTSIASGQWKRLYFANEYYDLANNFTPYPAGTTPLSTSSTFAPPIDGVYHLESNVVMTIPRDATAESTIRFRIDRGGVVSTLQDYPAVMPYQIDFFDYKYAYLKISGDFLLFNGDKIFVEVFQRSDNGGAGNLFNSVEYYFAGHLAIPY